MTSVFAAAFLSFFVLALALQNSSRDASSDLVVVNQAEHTVLLVDPVTRQTTARFEVGVAGHEVAISPDGKFAYIGIYGNSGVGKPGTDGRTIDIIDLQNRKLAGEIDLGKPVRPHCLKFGPDGLLYVSAELADALLVVDVASKKVVGEIPTGQPQSHMFVLSPDGARAYVSNVGPGSVSVLDLRMRSLLKIIPVAKTLQRISIAPDGKFIYTHDQTSPRVAVIDTQKMELTRWLDAPQIIYSSAITGDGRWLLGNSLEGKLFVWDLQKSAIAHTLEIPPSFGEIIFSGDGKTAYVSCPSAGTIEVINLREWIKEEPTLLSKGVDGMAFHALAK